MTTHKDTNFIYMESNMRDKEIEREILFRGQREDNHKWVYGYYFKTPLTDTISKTKPDKGWFFLSDGQERHCISNKDGCAYVVLPGSIGQWSGLFDKKKQMIFEDDFIMVKHWDPSVYKIIFLEGAFCFSHGDIMANDTSFLEDSSGINCEVIGNVHEHKNLIKETE